MSQIEEKQLKILHYYTEWLPLTMTWLYQMVTNSDKSLDQHVLCDKIIDNNLYKYKYLHSFDQLPLAKRIYDKVKRKSGVNKWLMFYEEIASYVKPDIIHSHFGHVGCNMIEISEHLKIPHVVTFYGMDVHMIPESEHKWADRYKKLFNNVSAVLCEGPRMAQSIEYLGCDRSKVIVQHIGVDLPVIPFKPREYNRKEPLKLLMASSFREKKGIVYGIKALGLAAKRVPVVLTIVGDADQDYESQLTLKQIRETIDMYNLEFRIQMKGYVSQSELRQIASDHHVFLAPSVTAINGDCEGGSPVVISEMAASGMLIISTKHCDIPNVIRDRSSGVLAEERNAAQLASYIVWAAKNPDKWLEMQINARERIEQDFDLAKQLQKLKSIYQKVS